MATGNPKDKSYQQNQNLSQPEETVEFHSEMPKVPDENVEFIPDEKLEEKIEE